MNLITKARNLLFSMRFALRKQETTWRCSQACRVNWPCFRVY